MNTDYLSYKASKVYCTDNGDEMYTEAQLEKHRKQAKQCSECPYPDDCHVPCPFKVIKNEPKMKKFVALHAEGRTDGYIGKKLGLKPIAVSAVRTLLGLKENKMDKSFLIKPDEDPCVKCKSKSVCKAFNATCGDKQRWESKR